MKPKSVVTSLAVRDLQKTLRFYRDGLQVEASDIEDGIIAIELANLSLFLIDQKEYEKYTSKATLKAYFPEKNVESILSCALETKDEVDDIFTRIEKYGGAVAQLPEINEWGQYIGYFQDPDGHLWEIVHSKSSAS